MNRITLSAAVLPLFAGVALAGTTLVNDASVSLQEAAAAQPEAAGEAVAAPAEERGWLDGWTGGVELGLNGSAGNTDRVNFRAGANAKRTSEKYETSGRLAYSFANDNDGKSENKFIAELRNDWLIKDSKWRVFAKGFYEYDDFQDWNQRLGLFAGVGYEFVKNDRTTLIGRIGAGVTKEIGGEENDLIPEGLLGLDLDHKINARQKLTATVEYYPSFQAVSDFRVLARAAWEILLDEETNLSLKIGAEDRYDSEPGDAEYNDFDYYALIVWSF